jgi:hypothetical protein
MNRAEWILLVAVVAILVGPFLTLKAVAQFRRRRGQKLPPARPYGDEQDD